MGRLRKVQTQERGVENPPLGTGGFPPPAVAPEVPTQFSLAQYQREEKALAFLVARLVVSVLTPMLEEHGLTLLQAGAHIKPEHVWEIARLLRAKQVTWDGAREMLAIAVLTGWPTPLVSRTWQAEKALGNVRWCVYHALCAEPDAVEAYVRRIEWPAFRVLMGRALSLAGRREGVTEDGVRAELVRVLDKARQDHITRFEGRNQF